MRYIRKEHIITTICNEEINDEELTRDILKILNKKTIEFSIIIRKYFPSEYDYKDISYKKVRVKNVDDNSVNLIVFDKKSIMHLKEIYFNDIIEINAITTINKTLKKKDITRWDLLDV